VFVHFHSGGTVIGNKNRESLPLLCHLASQGWVCISANYRLREAAQFTDLLIDVKKVIAWVRQHGTEYGANPETLILAGTSSGGQLAAPAGFTQNDRRFQPGFEREDTSVSGVVYLGGFYGFPGAAWPALEADAANAPPFLTVLELAVSGDGIRTSRMATSGATECTISVGRSSVGGSSDQARSTTCAATSSRAGYSRSTDLAAGRPGAVRIRHIAAARTRNPIVAGISNQSMIGTWA